MAERSWGNEGARGIDAADWLVELVCSDAAPADAATAIASGLEYPWTASGGCGKGAQGRVRLPSIAEIAAPLAGSRVVDDRGEGVREFAVLAVGVATQTTGR